MGAQPNQYLKYAHSFTPLLRDNFVPSLRYLQTPFCLSPPPNKVAVGTGLSRASRNQGAQPTQPTTNDAAYNDASPASPPSRPSAAALNS